MNGLSMNIVFNSVSIMAFEDDSSYYTASQTHRNVKDTVYDNNTFNSTIIKRNSR